MVDRVVVDEERLGVELELLKDDPIEEEELLKEDEEELRLKELHPRASTMEEKEMTAIRKEIIYFI